MSPVPKHVSVPLRPVLRPMAGTGHKLCISCPKDKGAFRMWPQDAMKSAKYCDERLNSFAETSRNALRRSRSGRPSVFDEVTKGPGFGLARGVSVECRPDLSTFEARQRCWSCVAADFGSSRGFTSSTCREFWTRRCPLLFGEERASSFSTVRDGWTHRFQGLRARLRCIRYFLGTLDRIGWGAGRTRFPRPNQIGLAQTGPVTPGRSR